ncbi:MAG: C45 family autoproteolytic acyltransferase/hydrolase [Bradymonadia bacterium]
MTLIMPALGESRGAQSEHSGPGHQSGGVVREVEGQTVVQLWGGAYDRGYAHGFLLRHQTLDLLGEYAVAEVGPQRYARALAAFTAGQRLPEAIVTEARGVIDGLKAAGGAHLEALGRALTAEDLLLLNAYTELSGLGCSSMSAWGGRSTGGAGRLVRQLDWSDHPALLRNQIIFVHHPDDPASQPFVSIGFAGYLGCLSCLGASGLGVFFNMAGRNTSLKAFREGFTPGGLILRAAVERRGSTMDTLARMLKEARHAGHYIVHAIEPARPDADPAAVFEITPQRVSRRGASDDPEMKGALVATNHHRQGVGTPAQCRRYRALKSANRSGQPWGREQMWLQGARVALPEVVHQLMVEPETRWMRVRLRSPRRSLADSAAPVEYQWSRWMQADIDTSAQR